MPKWESNEVAKIHEACGGLVRWVEAFDDPHVGYTGECLECGQERVVLEDMIPIETADGEIAVDLYNSTDLETLRNLRWDDKQGWQPNQKRLREKIE